MRKIERLPFADRATKELERIADQVKEGGQSAEDVINDVVAGVQKLVEDLAEWISNEVDRLGEMAEEQRRRAESQVQGLIDTMGSAADKAGTAAKRAPARKAPAKRKSTAKKAAKKKAPAKKKSAAKKAPAKKKATAKKASAKKKATAKKRST
jgi:ElaB/YqjD/DUF883 family membrane-anchored ribosome-binding protein